MSVWAKLQSRKLWRIIAWVFHVVLVVLIVFGLYGLTRRYRLDTALLSPFPSWHTYWLPILFLLVYATGWLVYGFIRMLSEPADDEFPDVQTAWNQALNALQRADIPIQEVPIYLVLGQPEAGIVEFFAATGQAFLVRGEPSGEAPLCIYANREIIFVAVEDAGALAWLTRKQQTAPPIAEAASIVAVPMPAVQQVESLLDVVPVPEPIASSITPVAVIDSPRIEASDWLPVPAAAAISEPSSDDIRLRSRRLHFLGRKIAKSRAPYCPVNGLLWLIPSAALASDESANQAAQLCRVDLQSIEEAFQLDCPMIALFADAQILTGFPELLASLPAEMLQSRLLGRSFPLVPNLPAEQRIAMVRSGWEWVVQQLIRGLIYARFGDDLHTPFAKRLWQLFSQLDEKRERAVRLIGQGLLARPDRPPMLSGIYLAATGRDARAQAFTAGIVKELLVQQNAVAWTPAARAREADFKRIALFGYAIVVVLLTVIAGLLIVMGIG